MNDDLKRGPGRPKSNPGVEREPMREPIKMKAPPNWETMRPDTEDTPDKLRISPDRIPDGMAALWVTDSILGKPEPRRRAIFERMGWTPVHQEDFDGRFDGEFMPSGEQGEIKVESSVLMMRPKYLSDQAALKERRAALEQVAVKEQSLKGGDIGATLDSQHPNALRSNRITKTVERIEVPEK